MIDGGGGKTSEFLFFSWREKGSDVFHSEAAEARKEQNMQLERRHTVKWSLLELMSAAICPHIKVPANEGLFIIERTQVIT